MSGRDRETLRPYLYFAYGSNLNMEQMAWRCPTARPYGRLMLPDWRLEFRGVADVTPEIGAWVAGALYTLRPGDELALDRYEGFRRGDARRGLYRKAFRRVRTTQGRLRTVMFYVMNRDGLAPPYASYLDTIRQGYRDWGLNADTLEDAVRRAESTWAVYVNRFAGLGVGPYGEDSYEEDSDGEDQEDTLTGSLFGGEW